MSVGNGQESVKIILCAGYGCAERESCARYRVRGGEFSWASFDLERKLYDGKPCPVYVEVRLRKSK